MSQVLSIANTENVNANIAPVQAGKRITPMKLDTLPVVAQAPVAQIEEEVEEDDFISDEEIEEEEDVQEQEEEEDEEQDALPEGCLAPEHEAMEASLYAEQLGFSDASNAIEYVGQNSWKTYEKVVDSYYKIIETDLKESEYEVCASDANQMNQQLEQSIMTIAKDVSNSLSSSGPSGSALVAARDVVYSFIEKAVGKAYLFTENRGDYIITAQDINEALRLMNPALQNSSFASEALFSDLADYKSEEDEDFVMDEEMAEDEEPLEWDSEPEDEEEQEQEDEVEEDEEEADESVEKMAFSKDLLYEVVNHFINVITPSDDPEEQEQEDEEKVLEVDVEDAVIDLLQQTVQEYVSNLFVQAQKVSTTNQSSPMKKPITNKDIKFVLDFCPELHF